MIANDSSRTILEQRAWVEARGRVVHRVQIGQARLVCTNLLEHRAPVVVCRRRHVLDWTEGGVAPHNALYTLGGEGFVWSFSGN